MRVLHTLFTKKNKKAPFVAGLAVALLSLFAVTGLAVHKASAADCDSNAIITCGVTSASNFAGKAIQNNDDHGHRDLQDVYGHQFVSGQYLTSRMFSDFSANAISGTAYKNGTIKLSNGQVVATDTSSIGREASYQGPGYKTYTVGSHTYYGNTNDRAFATDGLPVYVLFDSTGTMQFAVLKSCGNPIFGHVVNTSATCNSLQKTPVAGQANTYNFTASTNVTGNAQIVRYVYNFGDGSSVTVTSNFGQAVRHTYTKAGNFTSSVTQYVSVPGNNNLKLTVVGMCTKPVTVTLPFGNCVQLNGAILDKSKFSYSFVATAKFGNGATPNKAVFNFGDGQTATVTKLSTATTYTTSHQYAQAGKYNISALLYFTENGKVVAATNPCTASVAPNQPPTPTCKPNVPVGSPECLPPCQPGSTVPPTAPECTPPELPNTGAGNTIAIFSAVVIGGFLIYRQLLFRKHKAAFLAAQQGTSPLPLGEPLNDDAPLTGTPLAPAKRKSFRRKRPF